MASPGPARLVKPVLNGRVYARQRGVSGEVVLQIREEGGAPNAMSATVSLLFPVACD